MKKKSKLSTILLVLVFFTGLSLLLYPALSNYWNSFHASRAIAGYSETVKDMDTEQYAKFWDEANAYNKTLQPGVDRYILSDEQREEYNCLLDVSGTGVMGYIEIPKIDVYLPVYHGVSEEVLRIAVGHIEGTSLPVGGTGTHCAVSGHRGLPSARLFTSLDEMEKGDLFMIRILDEVLTYEVDRILTVEPDDMSGIELEPGKDLCTLVTCTPYGVNSHRMLVRGHRVENIAEESIRVTADAQIFDPILIAPLVAAPILLLLLVWIMVKYRR